jgi:predicted transcriptional regulator
LIEDNNTVSTNKETPSISQNQDTDKAKNNNSDNIDNNIPQINNNLNTNNNNKFQTENIQNALNQMNIDNEDVYDENHIPNLGKQNSENPFNNTRPSQSTINNIEVLYGESRFSTYKEYFEIFKHVSLNEYLTDLHNEIIFNTKIISVDLDCKLKEAVKLMQNNLIHRIVVEDTKNQMFVGLITYESIFSYFINNYYNNDMSCFKVNYKKLNIISNKIVVCYEDETIYSCLFKIWEARVSLLPILARNDKEEVIGYLFLKDLVYFMTNGENFKFSDSISIFLKHLYADVNEEKPLGKDRLVLINEQEEYSFKDIMEFLNYSPEKKIVIEKKGNDSCSSIFGIISLSDIFKLIFK